MAKLNILKNREATENLGYLIKLIVGSIIILGALIYLVFFVKPTYDQVKEIVVYIIIYLMGYGTQRVQENITKKNEK